MKFLSQEQKEVIAKAHGITIESINKRIEIWSLINDPDISIGTNSALYGGGPLV